jgi:hypothetical protein
VNGYVIVGYALTIAALVIYGVAVARRARAVRQRRTQVGLSLPSPLEVHIATTEPGVARTDAAEQAR